MNDSTSMQAEQARKEWIAPKLEVLSVRETQYWKFEYSPDGFPINVWVDES